MKVRHWDRLKNGGIDFSELGFGTAPLEFPFGRGVNLQIEVSAVDPLYASVQRAGLTVPIPLEERWYRQDDSEAGNRQFVVADPDGYLLRFFQDLGTRPA